MNKSKNNNQIIQTILGLITLILLCVILYCFLKSIWNSIKDYPTVTVAIITGLVSIIAIVVQRVWEKRYNKEQDIREKKLPIYQELINEFSYFLSNNPNLKTDQEKEKFQTEKTNRLIKFVVENNGKIIAWMSDDVLREWSTFRKIATTDTNNGVQLMLQIEKLFYAIRKDLGHKNKNLHQGDILRLFVNDIDVFLANISNNNNKNIK